MIKEKMAVMLRNVTGGRKRPQSGGRGGGGE